MSIEIRPVADGDRGWVAATIRERWGSDIAVAHGVIHRPAELEGFVALEGSRPVGLLTFSRDGDALEIVTIDAFPPAAGTGTALMDAAVETARARGCRRVVLMTTNDNLDALRFYQRRGFRIATVRPGAVAAARVLKPQIPETGAYGIPMRDELELERDV